jgi:hypothetical protein
MEMDDDKKEEFSNDIEKKEVSKCNQKINKYIKFPIMTWETILKVVIVIGGTIFMLVNFFFALAYSRNEVDCIDDMPQHYTESINNFFYDHEGLSLALKFILSFLIDILIIYTLLVWSLFGTNIRLISSGCTYMLVNLLLRFIHIQIQPEKSAFTKSHIFSIFVNYQVSTYSYYSVTLGIFIICTLEWKRNNVTYMFVTMLIIYILYIIFLIIMRGNYVHEIFTAFIFGHYFFIINEKVLEMIYGNDYLKNEIKITSHIPIIKDNDNNINEMKNNHDYETGDEDN